MRLIDSLQSELSSKDGLLKEHVSKSQRWFTEIDIQMKRPNERLNMNHDAMNRVIESAKENFRIQKE